MIKWKVGVEILKNSYFKKLFYKRRMMDINGERDSLCIELWNYNWIMA